MLLKKERRKPVLKLKEYIKYTYREELLTDNLWGDYLDSLQAYQNKIPNLYLILILGRFGVFFVVVFFLMPLLPFSNLLARMLQKSVLRQCTH